MRPHPAGSRRTIQVTELMENPTNTPEEKQADALNASAPVAQAQPAAKTGNLADTDSEYKHKHGEHKHHHHHHHRHRHEHFHPLNLTPSGIWSNLKLLAKTVPAYPYVLLFLAVVFLFFMESGLPLKLLEANRAKFATAQDYFAFQEYIVQNKALLVRIPFQFALVVAAARAGRGGRAVDPDGQKSPDARGSLAQRLPRFAPQIPCALHRIRRTERR